MKSRTIRVLSVSTSDSVGGAARAAYRIHLSVRECGVDSKLFVKFKESGDDTVIPLADFIPRNALYRAYDWVRKKIKNKWQHFQWRKYEDRPPFYLSDLRATDLCGALRRIDYDILHLHWINQRFIPINCLPTDKPIVWTLHDSWAYCGVCHYFLDCERYKGECGCCPMLGSESVNDLSHRVFQRKRKYYKRLNLHIVTPSRWMGNCAKQSTLLGEFPVTVIPNCVDETIFHPIPDGCISPRWMALNERKTGKRYLLYGAMNATTDKIKGFSYLLSALSVIEQSGKGNTFELIVFGADKPLEGLPVSTHVHYVGYVTDEKELASLYTIASVVVVPSITENLSCVIMESLACGTPVVAFDIGGNGDLIEHRINGYLAQKKDIDDLAHGILWCFDHVSASDAIRGGILSNNTPEIVARKYKDLYERLCQ